MENKLSNNAEKAISQVLDAFKRCRIYVSQDRWNNANGFSFSVNNSKQRALSGDEIEYSASGTALQSELPKTGIINVIKDGKIIYSKKAKSIDIKLTEKGVYRIEAKQRIFGLYKPWIYSNPIWVR